MKRILYECPTFQWLDVVHPSEEELQLIAEEYNLHPAFVDDCLEPSHLPKFERLPQLTFIIIRVFDKNSDLSAVSVQGLTRKIAIFIGPRYIITVHRMEPDYFKQLVKETLEDLQEKETSSEPTLNAILTNFMIRALRTYYIPLEIAEQEMDTFEEDLFQKQADKDFFKDIHTSRRRLSLMKRILMHTQDVAQRFGNAAEFASTYAQDMRENVTNLVFFTDEVLEDLTNLMNIQISLASQRTNEVMRVLTLFSVFFMPLTFIVGVYGMNFKFMPELNWEHGYLSVWVIMIGVSLAIGFWFYRRGWWK